MCKRRNDIWKNLEIDVIIWLLGMNMLANHKQIQIIVIKWSEFWQIRRLLAVNRRVK